MADSAAARKKIFRREKPAKKQVRAKRRSIGEMDTAFLLIVLILLAFGLIMVFSASYANALYYDHDSLLYIKKQGLFAVVGIVAMLLISKIDYRWYKKFVLPIYLFGLGLLVVVLFFEHNGARRWINLGPLGTFQPSEYMKLAVIIIFATMIAANYERMRTGYGVWPFFCAADPGSWAYDAGTASFGYYYHLCDRGSYDVCRRDKTEILPADAGSPGGDGCSSYFD